MNHDHYILRDTGKQFYSKNLTQPVDTMNKETTGTVLVTTIDNKLQKI